MGGKPSRNIEILLKTSADQHPGQVPHFVAAEDAEMLTAGSLKPPCGVQLQRAFHEQLAFVGAVEYCADGANDDGDGANDQ